MKLTPGITIDSKPPSQGMRGGCVILLDSGRHSWMENIPNVFFCEEHHKNVRFSSGVDVFGVYDKTSFMHGCVFF